MRLQADTKKIKSQASLKTIISTLKNKGKRIVFTNGCFDIVHRGHIEYLKKAKALGEVLVVAVNGDGSVRRLKGKGRPLSKIKDRAAIISALEFVDYVAVFNELTPLRIIKKLKPTILVKGSDWRREKIIGKDFIESTGGRVVTIGYLKNYSTTGLIKKIKSL